MTLLAPRVVGPVLLLLLALVPLSTVLVIGAGWYGYSHCWSTGFFLPFAFAYPLLYEPSVHGESAPPGGAKHALTIVIAVVASACGMDLAKAFYNPEDVERLQPMTLANILTGFAFLLIGFGLFKAHRDEKKNMTRLIFVIMTSNTCSLAFRGVSGTAAALCGVIQTCAAIFGAPFVMFNLPPHSVCVALLPTPPNQF